MNYLHKLLLSIAWMILTFSDLTAFGQTLSNKTDSNYKATIGNTKIRDKQSSQSNFRLKQITTIANRYQHMFSAAMAEFQKIKHVTAQDVIVVLNVAGIKRTVLLSTAYSYGRPEREPQEETQRVRQKIID